MTKLLALFVVVACSKSDDTKPTTATTAATGSSVDPWETSSAPAAPASDPWAATATSDETQPRAAAPADQPTEPQAVRPPQGKPALPGNASRSSTLTGRYECQQLRYGTAVNGMRQSTYVSSALGQFEIDADGTYRSASYPTKGTGRARANTASVTFEGGPYANAIGEAERTSSGSFHIRFSENLTEAPKPSLQFNDHMCYRK